MSKYFNSAAGGIVLTLVLSTGLTPTSLQAKESAQTSTSENPAQPQPQPQPQPVIPVNTRKLKPINGLVGSSKSKKKSESK